MGTFTQAQRQAIHRRAHRCAAVLQRRIYDELVAAFTAGADDPESILRVARQALQKAKPDDIAIDG